MLTCEQHTYTSSEHFHLEEGETMLARGKEIFFFLNKKKIQQKKQQKNKTKQKINNNNNEIVLLERCLEF